MSQNDSAVIEKLLKSKFKLDRDKGILELRQFILFCKKNDDSDTFASTVSALIEEFLANVSVSDSSSEWEPIQGCLLGLECIVKNVSSESMPTKVTDMQSNAKKLLTHDEVRVRLAAGEVLGSLCKTYGVETYVECSPVVLQLIKDNLYRQIDGGLDSEPVENNSTRKRLNSVDAATIYHESAGWRHLETSMKCLQCMIEGSGKRFNPYVTQELLDLIFTALSHENRFVRETGYYVCASLVNIGQPDEDNSDINPDHNSILKYGDQFSSYLAKGLSDNWSQVRLASSTAARHFLLSIQDKDIRRKFYPLLLPRICLNRYYVADGVRIYTQETWKKLSEGKGRDMVENYIDQVVNYYVESTQADNHAVREAACSCIAELGNKIHPAVLRPHVGKLLKTLLDCFKDDSWPVRDAACVACGNFIVNFAEEASDIKDELYKLFLRNLQDPISSVRQGAAGAVANFVKAYGDALDKVLLEIEEGLKGIEKQPENTEKYSGLDKSPAQFGVVKKLRDNDVDLHTNQTMYSCGSLAPKMGRGRDAFPTDNNSSGSRGGCSDCRFQRPSEPWERSDGCVYLISELLMTETGTASQDLSSRVAKLFPLVIKASSYQHFTQHVVFAETICRQIPIIAKRMGKRPFKPHLELFFGIIFYALECDTQLTSSAAEDCLTQLASYLGPSILRGRIEASNPRFLEAYDANSKRNYVSEPGFGPSPGSLTPFPRDMDPFANFADPTMATINSAKRS